MIYDKPSAGGGILELERYLGFISGSFDFSRLASYILLAQDELSRIFSPQVFQAVEQYYLSDAYIGDLSAEGLTPRDIITQYFQRAAGAYAYLKYAPNGDLSHDTGGRKIDMEGSQHTAFDRQIDRSDQATAELFSTSVNTIYELLEAHPDAFPQWEDSPARTRMSDTLLPTARVFSDSFDIGGSYFLFYKLTPSIRIHEATRIRPLLGDQYDRVRRCTDPTDQLSVMARRALAVLAIADNITKGSFAYFARNILPSDASLEERRGEYTSLMEEYTRLSSTISSLVSSSGGDDASGGYAPFANSPTDKYVFIPDPYA